MASNLPNSAQINEFASSFMSKLAPFGAQAAKGISQGLQYSKEAMGQASDVTELPTAYKELETQVDAIKNVHEQFLRISVNFTRKAYDYQPPLTDTALGYASTVQRGISSLIAKGATAAGGGDPAAEKAAAGAGAGDDKPHSLSHALAKAATVSREGLAPNEALSVSLKKFADTHNVVGDARVKM
ncbi:hypothetical protein HK100_008342, partial [Physocladia obscura]